MAKAQTKKLDGFCISEIELIKKAMNNLIVQLDEQLAVLKIDKLDLYNKLSLEKADCYDVLNKITTTLF